MEKKQMIWPFLAIVAIVAIVAVVMLVMNFNNSALVVDEEGNVVGEAIKYNTGKYCDTTTDCYGMAFSDHETLIGKSVCVNRACELRDTTVAPKPVSCTKEEAVGIKEDSCRDSYGRWYQCGKVSDRWGIKTSYRCVEKKGVPVEEARRCIDTSRCDKSESACYYGVCMVYTNGGLRTCSPEHPNNIWIEKGYVCAKVYFPPYQEEGRMYYVEPKP